MRLLRKMLIHDAVIFDLDGGKHKDGRQKYKAPRKIKVRWDHRQEEFTAGNGEKRISKACVFMGETPVLKSVLWLGKIADLTSTTDPFANPDAWEEQGRISVDTIKGRATLNMAYL